MQAFKLLLCDELGLRPVKNLIIINTLDKCNSNQDQKTFLTLIMDELTSHRIPLHFLICSRPEAHIREMFKRDVMKCTTLSLVSDETDDDIWKYLRDEFSCIFTEHRFCLFQKQTLSTAWFQKCQVMSNHQAEPSP